MRLSKNGTIKYRRIKVKIKLWKFPEKTSSLDGESAFREREKEVIGFKPQESYGLAATPVQSYVGEDLKTFDIIHIPSGRRLNENSWHPRKKLQEALSIIVRLQTLAHLNNFSWTEKEEKILSLNTNIIKEIRKILSN